LAWSHVNAKKQEMEAKIEEVAKMSRRLPKIQTGLDKAKVTLAMIMISAVLIIRRLTWLLSTKR
jgi:hypothetical protein